MGPGKTVQVPRAAARLYLEKARELFEQARAALEASRFDAAMLNAIHGAVSAADAVAVALAGRRSADPDHQRAVDLLQEVAGRSEEVSPRVRQLRTLLAKKNAVEYDARRTNGPEARDAVERAGRVVEWAREVVRRARV